MKALTIAGLMIALAFAGCAGNDPPETTPTPTSDGDQWDFNDDVPTGSVRFVVLGDVGSGMGGKQDEVADGVVKVCQERGCNFAIVAGDNIYDSGVRNEYDAQFNAKFEEPYADVDMPFYLVLGNHDNGDGGGTNPAAGDHQVAYSKRTDRPSEKWNMPARYYRVTLGDVTIVGIDSGPAEIATAPIWAPGARGDVMQQWLASEVPKITTKWKFAFAHHPYWSNSRHGDAGMYDNAPGRGLWYKRMLEETVCGRFNIFFTGHDHNMQWLRPAPSCPGTELVVSGAGGASLYGRHATNDHPARFQDYAHNGFFWIDVTGNKLSASAFDETGAQLFEYSYTI